MFMFVWKWKEVGGKKILDIRKKETNKVKKQIYKQKTMQKEKCYV